MSSTKFTAMQFTWLHQINEDVELPASAVKVALQLTRHFNEKDGGRAFPGYESLAEGCEPYTKDIGISERAVIRSIRLMHERGHLRVEWGKPGRGYPNQYWMIIKPALVQVLGAGKPASVAAVKPASVAIKPALAQENLLKNLEGIPKKEYPHRGEREEEASLALGDPLPARGGLNGHAPGFKSAPSFPSEESKPATSKQATKKASKQQAAAAATAAPMTAYDELRAIWQRGHISDERADRRAEDRRAYDRACRKAAPDQIFAAALKTVQAADARRLLCGGLGTPVCTWARYRQERP